MKNNSILKLFEAISLLHKCGYQKLRIMTYISPTGCNLRCELSNKESFDKTGFVIKLGKVLYSYSSGAGYNYFEDEISMENSAVEELANKLLDKCPEIAIKCKGDDINYVKWFEKVLDKVRKGNYPYAFEEYGYDIYSAGGILLTNDDLIEYAPMD